MFYMIEKVYKVSYWIFLVESIILIIGILLGLISYGIEVQTPIMSAGILIGATISTLLFLLLSKINSTEKKILAIFFSFIQIFLSLYYILEDQFRLLID